MYKVAIILASNIENAPYLYYYTDVLDRMKVHYDIIAWDRLSLGANGTYCFNYHSPDNLHFVRKLRDYLKYSRFVKQVLNTSQYDFVIVFTIVNVAFIGSQLLKYFAKRYIIDIRDYSPFYPILIRRFRKIILHSKLTAISSDGFRKWLPVSEKYIISHNIRNENILTQNLPTFICNGPPYRIVTFGNIRDYRINQKLLDDLKNSNQFIVEFVGSGSEPLEQYAIRNDIINTKFCGRYEKRDEKYIIKAASFINILFSRSLAHDGIISNRFYHALINRKPMIVSEGTIQAKFVREYNLGLIISQKDNILGELNSYISNFDAQKYTEGCNEMTCIIRRDLKKFESSLKKAL